MTSAMVSVTRVTASEAPWAIEVERSDGTPAEYYSVSRFTVFDKVIQFRLVDGTEKVLERDIIRKILVMRTN